jgi:hypothetical protein
MVQIYNEITIYILQGNLQRGYPLSALPHVEECTYFWGVNTSWGINMVESKRPLNQEDNQAPQPTQEIKSSKVLVW